MHVAAVANLFVTQPFGRDDVGIQFAVQPRTDVAAKQKADIGFFCPRIRAESINALQRGRLEPITRLLEGFADRYALASMDERLVDNRANWNDRVPIHWEGYDAEGYDREGRDRNGYDSEGYDRFGNHRDDG